MHKEFHEENRVSWNAATVALNSHKGDQAAFFRQGVVNACVILAHATFW
jgi:hypothetical protein